MKEEDKEFHLELVIQERYGNRELEHQINSGLCERVIPEKANLSPR